MNICDEQTTNAKYNSTLFVAYRNFSAKEKALKLKANKMTKIHKMLPIRRTAYFNFC